jgi:hypothetical protein
LPEDPKSVFRRLAAAHRRRESWWFTDDELKRPEDCWDEDAFIARIDPDVFEQMEPDLPYQGMMVRRNGRATCLWEDGESGVPETLQQYAREVDSLEKPTLYDFNNEAVNEDDIIATIRKDVFVDKNGRFEAWAPVAEAEDPKSVFKRATMGYHEERWCFTTQELKHPEACKSYDEFVANLGSDEHGHPITELGVVVERNGDVTNRWADGTRGVRDEYRQLADESDTLIKPDSENEADYFADYWKNVIVDKEGNFVAWAPAKARKVIEDELSDNN